MSYRSILNIPTENLSPLTDIENIQNGGSDYYRTVSVQDIDFNAGDYVVCCCESYEGGTQNDVWGAITFLDNGQQISNRAYIGQLIGKRIVLYLTEKPTTLCCYFGLNNGYTGKFSGVRINKLPQNFHTLCTVLGHNISEQEDVEHTSQTYLLTKYDNDWWDDFSQYKVTWDEFITDCPNIGMGYPTSHSIFPMKGSAIGSNNVTKKIRWWGATDNGDVLSTRILDGAPMDTLEVGFGQQSTDNTIKGLKVSRLNVSSIKSCIKAGSSLISAPPPRRFNNNIIGGVAA